MKKGVRKMLEKKTKMAKVVIVAVLCVAVGTLLGRTPNAMAGPSGWVGQGRASSSKPGGGGNNGRPLSCSPFDDRLLYTYHIQCTGVSWMYYTFVGGDDLIGKDNWIGSSGLSNTWISEKCAKPGSGFWHLGVNGTSPRGKYEGLGDLARIEGLDLKASPYTYRVPYGFIGHHKSEPYEVVAQSDWIVYNTQLRNWRWAKDEWGNDVKEEYFTSDLGQILYYDHKEMYNLTDIALTFDDQGVKDAFKEACTAQNEEEGTSYPCDNYFPETYAFCASSDIKPKAPTLVINYVFEDKTEGCYGMKVANGSPTTTRVRVEAEADEDGIYPETLTRALENQGYDNPVITIDGRTDEDVTVSYTEEYVTATYPKNEEGLVDGGYAEVTVTYTRETLDNEDCPCSDWVPDSYKSGFKQVDTTETEGEGETGTAGEEAGSGGETGGADEGETGEGAGGSGEGDAGSTEAGAEGEGAGGSGEGEAESGEGEKEEDEKKLSSKDANGVEYKEGQELDENNNVMSDDDKKKEEEERASKTIRTDTSLFLGVKNLTIEEDAPDNPNAEWHHNQAEYQYTENGVPKYIRQGVIYAKPADEVQWRYCYFPGVQFLARKSITVGNYHPHGNTSNNLTNDVFSWKYNFQNAFVAWTEELQPEGENVTHEDGLHRRAIGDPSVVEGFMAEHSTERDGKTPVTNKYLIQQRLQKPDFDLDSKTSNDDLYFDPGTIKIGKVKKEDGGATHAEWTEGEKHSWSCDCSPCSICSHSNLFYWNSHNKTVLSQEAQVYVPYNFTNDVGAELAVGEDEVLYSGEKVNFGTAFADVNPRQNDETAGNYATQIEAGRARLISFVVAPGDMEGNDPKTRNTRQNDGNGNSVSDNYYLWTPNGTPTADVKPEAATYADICDPAISPFYIYHRCKELDSAGPWLNEMGDMEGKREFDWQGRTTEVYDEAAGNYFCVTSVIYPYTVVGDRDMTVDGNGDYAWLISKPDCRVIAKRPTFQVWGGGVFSSGEVKTSVSKKTNIGSLFDNADYYNNIDRNADRRTSVSSKDVYSWDAEWKGGAETWFRSWTELSLTLEMEHDNSGRDGHEMASGAADGYDPGARPVGTEETWPGDSDEVNMGGTQKDKDNLCFRSPLTLANNKCDDDNVVGGAETDVLRGTLMSERDDLADRFPEQSDYTNTKYIRIREPSMTGIAFDEARKQKNTVVNIVEGEDILIMNNIIYDEPEGGYTDLSQIPKYLIYAKAGSDGSGGTIHISCKVERIDALLFATNVIDTCWNHDAEGRKTVNNIVDGDENVNNNSPRRQNQLVINGTVITDRLILGRAFGAGVGNHSITPAELINYDSSIYLWAYNMAEGASSGQFMEAASRELAPRY